MSTSIKRLSQNGQEFVPITLQEAVVVNTKNTIMQQALGEITTLDKVLRTIYGIVGNNINGVSQLNEAVERINASLLNKQDKLKPGTGITIAEDGTISASFDTTLYKVVMELPEASSDCKNSIYLVLSASGVGGNSFKEFICINKGSESNPQYSWEEIGTVQTSVDLSGYITKDEFTTEINSIKSALSSTITAKDVTTSSGSAITVTYDIPDNLYDSAITDQTDFI